MTFPLLQESCGDVSDVNTEADRNVFFVADFRFRRFDVVAALYNHFETRLLPCYKYGGLNLSSKHNYFK